MSQSYDFFNYNNSKNLKVLISNYVENTLLALKNSLNFLRNIFSFLFVTLSLFLVDPWVSFLTFSFVLIIYLTISLYMSRRVKRASKVTASVKQRESEFVSDYLSNVKIATLTKTQNYFYKKYIGLASDMRSAQSFIVFASNMPIFLSESLVIVGLALFLFVTWMYNIDSSNVESLLLVFGFGLQRFFLVAKCIYGILNSIVFV